LQSQVSYGQDPIFSITSTGDTYFNPANTFNALNSDSYLKLDVQFRDQWNALSDGDAYATSKLQAEYNIYKSQLDAWNIGVIFLRDLSNAGNLSYTNFQALGAYTRKLSGNRGLFDSHILTLGGSYGFNQTTLDIGDFWFGRQFNLSTFSIDPSINSGEQFTLETYNYGSLTLGARWTYHIDSDYYYNASLSVSNLNAPRLESLNTDVAIDNRIVFQAEARLPLAEGIQHLPSLFFLSQYQFLQVIPSYKLVFNINSEDGDFLLFLGGGLRLVNSDESFMADAFLMNIGLSSKSWSFGFNFDLNVSQLRTFTNNNGAIELALSYSFNRGE
jgi:hypothetical protein